MFIPICSILTNQLGRESPKHLVCKLNLPIPLRIIGYKTHMLQQRMIFQILDNIMNEMNPLIYDYS